MAIRYKVNILKELKKAGYNTTRIRREKLMGESILQSIREGRLISWAAMNKVCTLLDCQPGDLIEFVKDDEPENPEDED